MEWRRDGEQQERPLASTADACPRPPFELNGLRRDSSSRRSPMVWFAPSALALLPFGYSPVRSGQGHSRRLGSVAFRQH